MILNMLLFKCYPDNFLFHDLLGPSLPYAIQGHQMLRVGYDLIIIGGARSSNSRNNKENYLNKSIYRLSCSNKICNWDNKIWNGARVESVALAIPDDFVECD